MKELLPVVEVSEEHYTEAKTAADVEAALKAIPTGGVLAIAVEAETDVVDEQEPEEEESQTGMLALTSEPVTLERPRDIAISSTPGVAVTIRSEAEAISKLKSALADERLPKAIHDYKAATHVLERQGVALQGVQHDAMLYSYLLDPTYSSHRLADVALRRFNLKLSGTLPEAADITGRLATALRREVEEAGLLKLYEEIDLPLVPVLARMEHAGVKIDRAALAEMSSRLEREIDAKAKEIYQHAACEFNISSPKQLGDVLFNKLNLPKPVKYGKGKDDFHCGGCAGGIGRRTRGTPAGARIPAIDQAQIHIRRRLAGPVESRQRPLAYDLWSDRNGDGKIIVGESQSAKHSDSHRIRPRNSGGVYCRVRSCAAGSGLFADRTALACTFFERPVAG